MAGREIVETEGPFLSRGTVGGGLEAIGMHLAIPKPQECYQVVAWCYPENKLSDQRSLFQLDDLKSGRSCSGPVHGGGEGESGGLA